MINKKNYFSQVSSIDYNLLPDALKEGYDTIKFGSKDYSTWEYLDDDQEFLDVYFEKLNAFLSKGKDSPKKEESAKPEKEKTTEAAKKPKKEKPVSAPRKKPKAKNKPATKKEKPVATPVEKVSEEVRFIKRYVLLNGKEKTRSQVLVFLNSLQKAITEKRIRKTSPYAEEIMNIQNQLVKCYNKMGDVVKVNIAADTVKKYTNIAWGEQTMSSILFIKRYISLHGKANVKQKAEQLFKQMKNAADKKRITKTDPYKDKLEAIFESLKDYIAGKTDAPTIQKAELNGLKEIAIARLFSKKKG